MLIVDKHGTVCHEIWFGNGNQETDPDLPLQLRRTRLHEGDFSPYHTQLPTESSNDVSELHEAWIVLGGSISFELYDTTGHMLHSGVLTAGEVLITRKGYHTLDVDDEAILLEVKNLPYTKITKIGDV